MVIRPVFTGLILIAMLHPILHIFRNYPLQYIYFNEISGGVNKAYKKYETDYYLNSLKPATAWVTDSILQSGKNDSKLRIISNAPHEIMNYYFRDQRDKVDIPYTRYYDRGMYDWDYAVFFCNYIDPFQLKKNIWPPKNTIHEVKVDDVTVCAVVERKNKDDYRGVRLMNEGMQEQSPQKVAEGINLLEAAVRYDPYNEAAYLNLAQGYILIRRFDMARNHLNTLLSIYPDYDKALNMMGYAFLSEGDLKRSKPLLDRAAALFSQTIRVNYKFTPAYHNLGLTYFLKGDDETAMKYFNQALEVNGNYKQSYLMIATILEKRGDTERAAKIRQYAGSL